MYEIYLHFSITEIFSKLRRYLIPRLYAGRTTNLERSRDVLIKKHYLKPHQKWLDENTTNTAIVPTPSIFVFRVHFENDADMLCFKMAFPDYLINEEEARVIFKRDLDKTLFVKSYEKIEGYGTITEI